MRMAGLMPPTAVYLQRWLDGLPINPPEATAKNAEELAQSSFAARASQKEAGRPEVWLEYGLGRAGDTVTVVLKLKNGAPTAGFFARINYLAGEAGMQFIVCEETWATAGWSAADHNTVDGEYGSILVSANASEALASDAAENLLELTFTLGAAAPASGPLPLLLSGFEVSDQYGVIPRFGIAQQPQRLPNEFNADLPMSRQC